MCWSAEYHINRDRVHVFLYLKQWMYVESLHKDYDTQLSHIQEKHLPFAALGFLLIPTALKLHAINTHLHSHTHICKANNFSVSRTERTHAPIPSKWPVYFGCKSILDLIKSIMRLGYHLEQWFMLSETTLAYWGNWLLRMVSLNRHWHMRKRYKKPPKTLPPTHTHAHTSLWWKLKVSATPFCFCCPRIHALKAWLMWCERTTMQ